MRDRRIIRNAFVKSVPILCSYIFLGMAYGITMEAGGFSWYYSAVISLLVYTGAFQFVLISFMTGGASLAAVILTALLMNSRQSFYALSFIKDFKAMGRCRLFMIHSLTDETYAVNCTLGQLPDQERHDTMFYIALFSWLYWCAGSVLGGLIGQLLPFDLSGIDFCMTALFVIIFIDQWEHIKDHTPAMSGIFAAVICLIIFGKSSFMLPALIITSVLIIVADRYKEHHKEAAG